jgi:hypothetical protein
MDLKGQVVDQNLQGFQAKTPPEWYFDYETNLGTGRGLETGTKGL